MQKRDDVSTERMLLKYRIPIVKSVEAGDESEAVSAARSLGYPVVVKVVSPEIIHKTDIGGVALGIGNDDGLRLAIAAMRKKIGQAARITGFLIQKMEKGLEIIIGMKQDAQFGPVIMVGLGGIFVEFMKDVSFRIAPLSRKDAAKMLEELKGYRIIAGVRGQSYNVDALIDILLKVSELSLKEHDVREIDLNPVILGEEKAVVVDARIMGD